MVRSILLRGFDQDMARKIGEYMSIVGTNFIYDATPQSLEGQEDGKILVTYIEGGVEKTALYDTVLFAIGRYAIT